MSRIHITRDHALGLPRARQLAARWAEAAAQHFGVACSHEAGEGADRHLFHRAGVHGQLTVTAHQFVVEAKLGLLLGAFRQRIEAEIARNLDRLLAHDEPLAAFDEVVARRVAGRSGTTTEG